MAEDIYDQVEIIKSGEETAGEENAVSGKTFVITGALKRFENRSQLKELIQNMGGKVAGSVSGKTDYLINNDIASSSAKNKEAKKLGIPILTEEEFLTEILGHPAP